ncbi:hypothetical protein, partial [Butyrivibrio sp. FC2001]|uniref:hypothetical protein n=1 Tax=Butyrivibrio sp. FC2001 TaxID=1280671 RepID=UPI00055F26AA
MRRPDATLDSTKNNCWIVVTDGEELKNNQIFSVARGSVAVIFCALKGKPLTRWLGEYLWLRILEQSGGVESVGTDWRMLVDLREWPSGGVTSIREQVSVLVDLREWPFGG